MFLASTKDLFRDTDEKKEIEGKKGKKHLARTYERERKTLEEEKKTAERRKRKRKERGENTRAGAWHPQRREDGRARRTAAL